MDDVTSSSVAKPQNPWGKEDDGEVHLSSKSPLAKHLLRPTDSVHTSRSSRASRSLSAVSSRKIDAVADAAALKAKLRYLDEENKRKAKLEQMKAELERFQTMKELDIAEAQISAIVELEGDDGSSHKSLSLPDEGDEDYVQKYVDSLTGAHAVASKVAPKVHQSSDNTPKASEIHASHTSKAPDIEILQTSEHRALRTGASQPPSEHQALRTGASQPPAECRVLQLEDSQPPSSKKPELNVRAKEFTPRSSSIPHPGTQYDIARSLAEQLAINRMPPPEPGVFDGDPLKYPLWKAAFETLIEQGCIKPSERIYYLRRYLSGSAKEAVEGYFLLSVADDSTYQEAKELLSQRYGNSFVVANAFRDRLDDWPKIPTKDGLALRKYADFLRQCNAAMRSNSSLQVLDDAHENHKMLGKLPDWMIPRWGRFVADYKEKSGRFPPFGEFVKFVVKEANIACEPITSLQSLRNTKPKEATTRTEKGQQRRPGSSTFSTEVTETKLCVLCDDRHHIDECKLFLKKTMEERKEYIKNKGLCYACLEKGHRSKFCKQRRSCRTCSKRHPTALHGDKRDDRSTQKGTPPKSTTAHTGASHLCDTSNTSKSSMIVPVWVSHYSRPDMEVMVYALLDSQSDTTFILDKICTDLGVEGCDVKLSLSTMSAKDQLIDSKRLDGLRVRAYESSKMLSLPATYTRDIMPANRDHIPTPDMARRWPHLQRIATKIPPLLNCEVGLLIGYNCASALAPREVIPPASEDQPYGQRTDLGWGIVGIIDPTATDLCNGDAIGVSHRVVTAHIPAQLCTTERSRVQVAVRTTVKECMSPLQVIKSMELDFCEQESDDKASSQEDKRFLKIVEEGIQQRPDKHYQIPLPFREINPRLPNNKVQASHRLQQLKGRFQRDSTYQRDYAAFMENIIQRGFAEPVPGHELLNTDGSVWYIPHHGVYHSRKPDKIRVVFDCSAKFKGESLNEHLLQGPDLTNALIGVLCRFREERIAFTCDVEQMFFQFRVALEHKDYLRFLWWENGNYDSQPKEYRMNVHLFGAVSSPACANFGLRRIADDNEAELGVSAANFIRENFYVDDGLASVATPSEATKLIKDTREMCARGGLRLHKFASNSKEVMADIPLQDRASGVRDLDLIQGSLPAERALGVEWCIESDSFRFRIVLKDQPLTRRGILSTVCSIYDPLGFIAPVILVGKQILQQMCKDGADWDAPISETLRPRWERWRNSLTQLENFKLQRCLRPHSLEEITTVELHHFSDASSEGYGQCSYLRLVDTRDQVHCALVMGKARVTPLKAVTVPRLELTAAVVSVRISNLLKRELRFKQAVKETFWTDSKVVLGYIANESRRFHVFVANRVQKIRDFTEPTQWRFVGTDENPADDASRGISAKDLVTTSKWLTGPDFLWSKRIPLDRADDNKQVLSDNDPEVKRTTLATNAGRPRGFELERLECFSTWISARKAVAHCIKYKALLKRRAMIKHPTNEPSLNPKHQSLTVEDFRHAEHEIIKWVQRDSFGEELEILRRLKSNQSTPSRNVARKRNQAIKATSCLYRLDPYLDEHGIMRVGGRLSQAHFPLEIKHPAILPRKHHITQILIRHCHENVEHQGRGTTTNEIRSNGFWILGCSSAVSDIISRCVKCRRLRSQVQEQKMSNLPMDRLQPVPPFTYCAVDYFGPWHIKEGRKELKRYGVLFTCMTSRAIHIETAASLSTDSFINALRRFIAIRGPIRQLRCDRGTNFVGAEAELKKACLEMNTQQVHDFLLKENCDYVSFNMNVPSASHMGGVWERQIRTVRNILASLMGRAGTQLDDESLRTFMSEAAAIVNSRPLTVDNVNDPTSLEPLTPNHILTQKSKIILPPPGEFQRQDMYLRKCWRRVQYLTNEFWSRWRREYLQSLQPRSKWVRPRRDLKSGDIVIIKEEKVPRNRWQLGRVEVAYPDEDGHVRKVKLAIGDRTLDRNGKRTQPLSYLDRPIHKLVLLLESSDTST